MQKRSFQHDGLTFSYLDAANVGEPLIALHAHWMESRTFAPLAQALAPQWRVIALDQRGHGDSDHAATYSRDDYIGDLLALFDHLEIRTGVVLGNSLGGVNAYQFAARHPERVHALIVEDIGAVIADDTSFALGWAGTFKTQKELEERIGPRIAPYLRESFRHGADGWRLAFDPNDTAASQQHLNGDHWSDWLASRCPVLLIRGQESRVTQQQHLEEMAQRRPGTEFLTLQGGHVVHVDNPGGFADAVRTFLMRLPSAG